ncbi:uncharacterized protein LOC120538842 [Polypterus senegalus]|uniref:uncharacterized protein LOC120538842 n=1 Tax=Polypterus senegalus TaxID=55291 RepID=UPI00196449B9|nr:uncharacterized protein LOC120538842 [Polypterus senegalus]
MWRCLLIFQLLFLKEVAGGPIPISVGNSRKSVEDLLDKDQNPDEILQINNYIWKKHPRLMLEGDILKEVSRHALSTQSKKWPKTGKCVYVPYVLSTQYNDEQRKILYEAFENFARVTCIRFKKQEDETDFLFIAPVSGCYSYIGRSGGSQLVSLDSACIRLGPGVAQHELMHALGFYHEQTRPDRDSYVKVIYDNIDTVFADNFQIREGNLQGIPYDYASIMHYSNKAFSKNGDPTMVPFPNSNIVIGQRKAFSDNDILRINLFYNCDMSQLGAACEFYSFDNPSKELNSLDETLLLPPLSKAAAHALRNVKVEGNNSIFSLLSNMEFSDIFSPAFPGRDSRSLSLNTGEAEDLTTSPKTSMYWTTEAKSSKGILSTTTGDPAEVSTISKSSNILASLNGSGTEEPTVSPDVGNLIASLSNSSDSILALLNASGTEEPTVSPDVSNLIASVSNSPGDISSPPPRGSRSISDSTEEPNISNLIASLSNSSDNILASLSGSGTEEPTVSPDVGNLIASLSNSSDNILASLSGSGTEEPTVSPDVGNLIASISNSPGDILSPTPRGSRSISDSTEEPNISNLIASLSNSSDNILALLNASGTEEPTVSPDVSNLIASVSNSPGDISSPPPRGSRSISDSTEEPNISNLIASLSNSSDNILALLSGSGTEEPTVSPDVSNLIASVSNSPGDISSPPPRGSRSISDSTEEPNISNLIASLSNSSDNILALLSGSGTEEPTVSPDVSNLIASLSNSSDNILASLNGLVTEEPTDVSTVSLGVRSMAATSNSSVNILGERLSEAQFLHSCNFELNLCGWKHWPSGDFDWTLCRERPEEFEKNSLPNGETSCRNFAGQYLYLEPPFLLERVQTAVLVSPVFQGSKCFSFWYSVFGQGVKLLAIHLQYLHSPDSWHKLWSVERSMTRTWYFEKLDILVDADIRFQIILEGTLSNVTGDAAIDDIVVSGYGCEEISVHPSPSAESGLFSTNYPALPLSNDLDPLFCDFESNFCGWQLCSQGDLNWILHRERSLDTVTLLNTSLSGCSMFQGQYLYAEVTTSYLGNRALLVSPRFQGSRCMSFWYSMFGNEFGSLNVYIQYAKSPDTWNKVWVSKGSNSRKWYLAELDLFIQPHEVFQIILEWTTEGCCGNVAVDDLFVNRHRCDVKTRHEPCKEKENEIESNEVGYEMG